VGREHASFASFLLISVPARYVRFLARADCLRSAAGCSTLGSRLRLAAFYVFYFWRLGCRAEPAALGGQFVRLFSSDSTIAASWSVD